MGKKLLKSEKDIRKSMILPKGNDIIGIVTKNLGYPRRRVTYKDEFKRLCRIRGKMKKRNWVREGDAVLTSRNGISSLKRKSTSFSDIPKIDLIG